MKCNLNHIAGFKVCFYFLVSRVHTGGNTVEINTEVASSDIPEYPPPDDKASASTFGFLCTLCAFMSSFYTYGMHARLFVAHVLYYAALR